MNLKLQATNVLKRIHSHSDKRLIILQGGSRSSKTYSIFQYFILKALTEKPFTLTIARKVLADSKTSLLPTFEKVLKSLNVECSPSINPRRQEQIYKINGSEFAFFGVEDAGKLHGREQDYFWVNEAIEVDKMSFDQLEQRTNIQGILDYNPSDDEHWIYKLKKRNDVGFFTSTQLDNPFLPEAIRRKILGYEPTPENDAQGTSDAYMWEVYGLGNPAKLQGAIFTNWAIVPEIPGNAEFKGYGLDFGYSNDPAALVELYTYDNEIYLNEMFYEKGMLNQHIAQRMRELGVLSNSLIVADSSEPKSIEEIYRSDFRGIIGADKGPDSVNFGIDLMKQYKINITAKSVNLEKEFRKYKWREDKNGKSLNKPVDEFNHAIDAARYIIMSTLKKKHEVKVFDRWLIG